MSDPISVEGYSEVVVYVTEGKNISALDCGLAPIFRLDANAPFGTTGNTVSSRETRRVRVDGAEMQLRMWGGQCWDDSSFKYIVAGVKLASSP